ncbi:cytochrome c [Paenibacillus sp. IB182496]|uniref:Cytochrome c n=1 Tax=Paenibacillus sabuli TaxID=2772509 RepID=A0A927BVR7_9BACL|nr:cytochrome c [Paenibacillus sabuli]MBD2847738.1 cytochrome c [Paenibacillus sabuli]
MKWAMFGVFIAAVLLSVYLLLFELPEKESSEETPEETVVLPDTPVDAGAAETLYAQSCIGCHGDQMQGGMGPALSAVGSSMTREEIYTKIMEGGGGMPSFETQLSEDEIINVSGWLADMK